MAACNNILSMLKGCDANNVGGIFEVYINDQDNISATTVSTTAHTVTAISLSGGVKYSTFQFKRNIGNLQVAGTPNLENGNTLHKVTLSLKFTRREATKSRALQILGEGQRYLSIIIKDAMGQYTYIDYAQLSASNEDSGTKKEDGSMYDLTFVADLDTKPYFVDPAIMTSTIISTT